MNDPSTLATTAHDDRDGPPPAPIPTTGPPAAAAPSGLPDPTPATMPPLDAVAAGPLPTAQPTPPVPLPTSQPAAPAPVTPITPVTPALPVAPVTPVEAPPSVAPATGAAPVAPVPPSGDPTVPADDPHTEPIRTLLETAATCRPVEEVTALVNLLRQTGQLPNPGHEALRAAAVSRPVHEVRHMVALLGEHPHEEGEADITLRAAAVGRSIEDVALLVSILGPDGTPRTDRPQEAAPPPPQERGWGEQVKRERNPRPTAPRPAPVRAPERPQGPLRHLLRWPAAAALLLCGVVHLPGDLADRPAPAAGDLLPLAVSLLCLGVGALLAVRDTVLVWRLAAVTALTVVTLHVVGGVVLYDPLEGALGGPHTWAGIATVLCAGAGALLAGLALRYRPDRARSEPGT
ncbi:hypothetical protein [Streptomyces sp. NPDC057939]|uniref:hypothetical protein n=1 Tax=Streptomyces sp. NPDC057939 TaxID=3346284 RepID=UPI0036E40054